MKRRSAVSGFWSNWK
jgi:hypothetical protein